MRGGGRGEVLMRDAAARKGEGGREGASDGGKGDGGREVIRGEGGRLGGCAERASFSSTRLRNAQK